MPIRDLVIQSQLVPPSQRKGLLHRARLAARLRDSFDYPLTIVQASTGNSKTTTLAAFANTVDHLFWYTINETDRDPLLFLAHLISCFNQGGYALGEKALQGLEENGGRVHPGALTPLLNALTTGLPGPSVLVIDDYHLVASVLEINNLVERLVDYAPPQLHIILSTRQMPPFSALTRWRVKNQLLTLHRKDLAFTADEIEALYKEQYGVHLSPKQVQALFAETEGWAIALQMIWQRLQSDAVSSLDEVLQRLPETLESLFDYLAQEILARQPAHIQRFLLITSVLRELTGSACDALLEVDGSQHTLEHLHEQGLFVSSIGENVYRYQNLFQEFLYSQLKKETQSAGSYHCKAGAYFRQANHPEETIYHYLEAGEQDQAAEMIEEIGPNLVRVGRLDSLASWIKRLSPQVLTDHPELHLLFGDAHRLRSHFDEALESYGIAEQNFIARGDPLGQSRALRGQAQVYLDTIRPLKADSLLESALLLLDPNVHRHEMADLLEQLAENRLNLGRPDQAQAYHREAKLLSATEDPADIFLESRALLRTGRIKEARRLLESRAEEEQQGKPTRPQRFHREIQPLLSLFGSLLGDVQEAERYAREGIATGRRLESAFVEAVGFMRLGHPLLLSGLHPWLELRRQGSIQAYQRAIEIVRPFRVTRITVEPLWGLCQAYGTNGDLVTAGSYAAQALEISNQAGDEWISNMVRISMGSGLVLAHQPQLAAEWLRQALLGFKKVGDPFGAAAVLLWDSLNDSWHGQQENALRSFTELLQLAENYHYEELLTRKTYTGLRDEQNIVPLLLAARSNGISPAFIDRLLHLLDLEPLDYHPGYTLFVRTLGPFEVWRGTYPIKLNEWQREKARQLFQLFVHERGRWMTREQIADQLWPHLDPESAARDFKAALNALNHAVEPARPSGTSPFFIIRRENFYGINPKAKIVLDSDDFESWAKSERINELRQALTLYEQDYMLDAAGGDWATPTREYLRQGYMHTAERMVNRLIQESNYDEAIQVCQEIISRDSCWEPAYQLLMQTYTLLGNYPQVQSIYNRLAAVLEDELDVQPSPETKEILKRLVT